LADVRLKESSAEEACHGLTTQLNERARDLTKVKALLDDIEARYVATSTSKTLLQSNLKATVGKQKAANEAQQVVESRMKSAEESKQVVLGKQKKSES
jgi:hypothetical protein